MKKQFTKMVNFVGSKPQPFKNVKKYISTGALKTDCISEDDVKIIDYMSRPSRADLEVNAGDILFAKMAYTDKRLLVNDFEYSHIYSTGFFAVKPKKGILTSKCLYYLLSSETFKNQKDANSTGATQKAITIQGLKKIKLRVPEYYKQDQIGSVLENIERIIKYKQQQLQGYDQLIKSRFVEMFEDEQKKLKLEKIAKIGSSHRVFVDEFVEFGVPFYRGTEIGLLSQGITDFKPYYISKSRYDELASDYTKPEIGDILMPSICDKGQLWIVNTVEPFYYKDGRVLSIRPDKEVIIPGFLHYFLKIKLTEIYKEIATGATFAEFKIFLLKDINVVLPSINRQKQFADFAKQVDKLKFVVQKSLDETQKLFDSLMQEYFG